MNRRFFLSGSLGLLAAPAIVRVGSLMSVTPVYVLVTDLELVDNVCNILDTVDVKDWNESSWRRKFDMGCYEIPMTDPVARAIMDIRVNAS